MEDGSGRPGTHHTVRSFNLTYLPGLHDQPMAWFCAGPYPTAAHLRLYDRFRFGDLVRFSILNGRQYSPKQPCEVPPLRRGRVARTVALNVLGHTRP